MKTTEIKKKKIFYAVLCPNDQDIEMEMMIGHGANQSIQPTFIKFGSEKINFQFKNLKEFLFFQLKLEFNEEKIDGFPSRILKSPNESISCDQYQIKIIRKIKLQSPCEYYEDYGKFREILDSTNNFAFNLKLNRNEKYYYYKDPQVVNICSFCYQTLAFLISFIELEIYEPLSDFLIQHKKFFANITEERFGYINDFFGSIVLWIEAKAEKFKKIDNFVIFISLFGLLPRWKTVLIRTEYFTKIYEIAKNVLLFKKELVFLNKKPEIYNIFIEGCLNMFLLEEKNVGRTATWVDMLFDIASSNKDFSESILNQMIFEMTESGLGIEFSLSEEKMEKIKILISLENLLIFSADIKVFIFATKNLILAEFSNLIEKNEETIKELPFNLNEKQDNAFKSLKKKIEINYGKILKKTGMYFEKLENISDFMIISQNLPNYLKNIFHSEAITQTINYFLMKKCFYSMNDDYFLDYLQNILMKSYDPFLLHQIDIIPFLRSILNYYSTYKENFLLKFFRYFMLEHSVQLKDYFELLRIWTNKFKDLSIYIDCLDKIMFFFEKEKEGKDKEVQEDQENNYNQKKYLLLEEKKNKWINLLFDLDEYYLKTKLTYIIQKVVSKEILNKFKQQYIEKVIKPKEFPNLLLDKYDNPLTYLEENYRKFDKNETLSELIQFCFSLIAPPTQQEIFSQIFENPKEDSLLFKILTDDFNLFNNEMKFKLKETFHSILQEIESNTLEAKWIYCTEGLSDYKKKLMNQMLMKIQTSFHPNQQKEEPILDILLLLKQNKQNYDDKIKVLEDITDVISAYCFKALDYDENYEIIRKIRVSVNEKRINEIVVPENMINFLPFAQKLNPYIYLESFEHFRNTKEKNLQPRKSLKCLELALSWLQEYKNSLNNIIENPQIIIKEIKIFFLGVSDMKKEGINLQKLNFLTKEQAELICEILEFIQINKEFKHFYREILKVVKLFDLSCDFLEILEKSVSLKSKLAAREFHSLHKSLREKLPIKQNSNLFKMILEFDGAEELFQFTIETKKQSEIEMMKEAVNDYDESHVSTQTIFDFINFWSFFNEIFMILGKNEKKTLSLFLNIMEELTKNHNYLDILSNFKMSKIHLLGIKDLYLELTHKEEAKRKQIFKIIENSKIKFLKEKKTFDVEVSTISEEKNKNQKSQNILTFKALDITELKHRANLIVYTEQNKTENKNYQEEEVKKFKDFDTLAESLLKIIESLNKLKTSGYPDILNLIISGLNTTILYAEFRCIQCEFEELLAFQETIADIMERWYKDVNLAYKKFYELTFLKGKDFWKVEQVFIKGQGHQANKGTNFLKFMYKKYVHMNKNQQPLINDISPEERLFILGDKLHNLPDVYYNPKIPEIKTKSPFEDFQQFHFFIVNIHEKPIITQALFSLFYRIDKTFPRSYQILICHNYTTWNELLAFAHRCFFSPKSQLFCLILPENLAFDLQDRFASLFRDLINEYKRDFSLAFITNNEINAHLISSLKFRKRKIFKNDELLNVDELNGILKDLTSNCLLMTSSISGMGKTEKIRKKSKELGQIYKKLPIAGCIDPLSIGKQLQNAFEQEDNILLNICLGSIKDKDKVLLNLILISMVLLRSFNFSKNVMEIPQKVRIVIELDSSFFETLRTDIEIFKFIENDHTTHINWKKLYSQDKEIQFICHCLKALNDKSIGKLDITEENCLTKKISPEEIFGLLNTFFLKNKDINYVTFNQYTIFKKVLYSLFKGFSSSSFFSCGILMQSYNQNEKGVIFLEDKCIIDMRISIAEALIASADQFTSKSIQNVRDQQSFSIKASMQLKNNQEINNKIEEVDQNLNNAVVSWENSRPFFIIFTEDHCPLYIYKNKKDIPKEFLEAIMSQINVLKALGNIKNDFLIDYNEVDQKTRQLDLYMKLCNLTNTIFKRNICLVCFRKFEITIKFCSFCKKDLLINSRENQEVFINKVLEASLKDYVLTLDNYIKMLMIYMRVMSNIPVIIKGETGCGKTSLIRFLCTKILEDEFHLISIHAGVTDDFIINEMNLIMEKAINLTTESKIWVFFDEFNTTESIGLIKEIMCERTLLGQPISGNIVFLGACNPFRLKSKEIVYDESVGIKKPLFDKSSYNLLYTVQPLPESLIEYVWDYGHLAPKTEKEYIYTMFRELDTGNDKKLCVNLTELIGECHAKFRFWEDVSSVSLRDVARYKKLYIWFVDSLRIREGLCKERKKKEENIYRKAAILAFLHCYYLRISSEDRRSEFLKDLDHIFQIFSYKQKNIEELLINEENDFLERMEPFPEGIAKNQALRENVFSLIVCIVNKIPLFICGKPGCSKSLAIQLVFTHLRGKKSNDPYFRTLPELIPTSYQGSELCTSESILTVFARAEKYLKVTNEKDILPVIWFDEIGLAELSSNNPLKVLHNKLEIENIKVAFVGISNWRLDASKMNRALYLARPDPNVEDLKFTAREIFKSVGNNIYGKEHMIESFAQIYVDLRVNLKEKRMEDIFGLRDYYHLNKGISQDLMKMENRDEIKEFTIVRKNIKKNFSGLGNEYQFLWERYCQYMGKPEKIFEIKEPSILDLIRNNLKERNSRYLMIITDNECITEYIEDVLTRSQVLKDQNLGRNVKTIVGSNMSEDVKDTYLYRILSDVILYLEKGYTLIFKKVDHIYCSLYDLFNQNFSLSGDKKYCRIALGALYNPKCLVDSDFHCLIFVNEKDLTRTDPPFLNRFEKYHLKLDDILEQKEINNLNSLNEWVMNITGFAENQILSPKYLFPNFSREYLIFLIKMVSRQGSAYSNEKLIRLCQTELIKTSSFDFPVLVSFNCRNPDQKYDLIQEYYKLKGEGFQKFVNNLVNSKEKMEKAIVYTYTQINETINYKLENEEIREIKLGNFKSEQEIKEELKKYFQSKQHALLVIRVNLSFENMYLLSLRHLLANFLDEITPKAGKNLMIIIHMQRFAINEIEFETLFQNWDTIMFDHLKEDYLLPIDCIEDHSFSKLSKLKGFLEFEEIFYSLIDQALSKFKYSAQGLPASKINERRNFILDNMRRNIGSIMELIQEHIVRMRLTSMEQENKEENTERKEREWTPYSYLQNGMILATAISPLEAIKICFTKHYNDYLLRIVYESENLWLFDAYFLNVLNGNEYFKKLWRTIFTKMEFDPAKKLAEQIFAVKFHLDLQFPFSKIEGSRIRTIQEMEKPAFLEINDNFQYEKLLEQSFLEKYEQFFYENLLKEKKIFSIFMKDQVCLFLQNKYIELSLEIAWEILYQTFFNSNKEILLFFLNESKRLLTIYKIAEDVLKLKEGKPILENAINSLVYYEDRKLVVPLNINQSMLLAFEGDFYRLEEENLKELQEENLEYIENLVKDESEYPFVNIFFERIVESISELAFLKFFSNDVKDLSQFLQMIQENIWQTRIIPLNFEKIVPWIEITKFLNTYDESPSTTFSLFINFLEKFEINFADIVFINKMIDFLKNEVKFVKKHHVDKDRKFLKLTCQLLKNIASIPQSDFTFFEQILLEIDKNPIIWVNSSKIFIFIDAALEFSSTVLNFKGQLPQLEQTLQENQEKAEIISGFERTILKTSPKVLNLFLNKVFSMVCHEWIDDFEGIINDKFEIFKEILDFLKLKPKDQKKSFLLYICLVWIKAYIFLFAIALNEGNVKNDVLIEIEGILNEESSFISTLQVYITKLLLISTNKTKLQELKPIYGNLSFLRKFFLEIPNEIEANFIIPLPLKEKDSFFKMEQQLNQIYGLENDNQTLEKFLNICGDAKKDEKQLLCFNFWFLKLYSNFLSEKFICKVAFINLIEDNQQKICKEIGRLGMKLILFMLKNFNNKSFFRLEPGKNLEFMSQKLAILALFVSLASQKNFNTRLASFFFEKEEKAKDFPAFIKESLLFGLIDNNERIINIKRVKTDVEERLKTGQIVEDAKYIYKCSQRCEYIYIFHGCGRPYELSKCPLCNEFIGATIYNQVYMRNNGFEQIRIPIPEGLVYIDEYVRKADQKEKKGYIFNNVKMEYRGLTKSYLKAITFRVFHWMLHSSIVSLYELEELSLVELQKIIENQNVNALDFFREHSLQDHKFMEEILAANNEVYIWLFQMIGSLNQMNGVKNKIEGAEDLTKFELLFEEKIINPLILSVPTIIHNYKQEYAARNDQIKQENISNYINEVKLNDLKYSFLEYFGLNKLPSIEDFKANFLLNQGEKPEKYPLLHQILSSSGFPSDIMQINHLIVLIEFSNDLMNRFQYRISREKATSLMIKDLYEENSDIEKSFKEFALAWNSLNLKEITVGCQRREFVKIDESKSLSFFLPNQEKDESGLMVLGVLLSLRSIYNNFIYNARISANPNKTLEEIIEEEKTYSQILQNQSKTSLIRINKDFILNTVIEIGFMNNWEYGKGKEICYDFDEIENNLGSLALGKPCLNTDMASIRTMNYQFETYQANRTIDDIRKKNKQTAFDIEIRNKYKNLLKEMNKKDLIDYLGSLDYVFTFLRNMKENIEINIEEFCKKTIKNNQNLNDFLIRRQPLCSIKLCFILDLYDLVEEIIFDTAIKDLIKLEKFENFEPEEKSKILKLFYENINKSNHPKISSKQVLNKVFKKIIFRILVAQIDIDQRLRDYFERDDIWDEDVDAGELERLALSEEIKLKHAYIIWKDLNAAIQVLEEKSDKEEKNENKGKSQKRAEIQTKHVSQLGKGNRKMFMK